MSTLNRLKSLDNERQKLFLAFTTARHMLRGSFGVHTRKCGTATCWCANSDTGHPQNRIAWGKNARGFSKIIPQEDVAWIKKVTDAYRSFKKCRKRLREINEEERVLLGQLEDELVEKTEKLRDYL